MRGSMVIAVNAVQSDNCIKRFKTLRGKEHGRAKATNVLEKVNQDMELALVEPCWINFADTI
jgi:hypothetical protein